jgi:integrase/recombinase XerD
MQSLLIETESFIEYEAQFKNWLSALGYAPKSVVYQPRHIRELFFYLERQGFSKIQSTDKEDIKAFFAYLSQRTNQARGGSLSLAYVAKYWQAVRNFDRFLKSTQEWGFDLPKQSIQVEQVIKAVLTQSEIKKMYQACSNDYLGIRDKAMLSVFYGCGLRRSEGIGLNVEDILFNQNLIHVRLGKNYKERYVPMNEQIKQDLQNYLDESRTFIEQYSPFHCGKPTPALLLSQQGKRISDSTLIIRIRHLQEQTADKKLLTKSIALHTLRHSVATHLLQNGMKLKQIALFLGHSSIESTQIYTHLNVEK